MGILFVDDFNDLDACADASTLILVLTSFD